MSCFVTVMMLHLLRWISLFFVLLAHTISSRSEHFQDYTLPNLITSIPLLRLQNEMVFV